MVFASIILWSASLLHAGEPGVHRLADGPGPVIALADVAGWSWGRPGDEMPRRSDRKCFLVEEEDEDDTLDDAPLAWGHGASSILAVEGPGGRLAARHAAPASSRSAAPTLRLRC